MDGQGLLVIAAFFILILAIFTYTSCEGPGCNKEGFTTLTQNTPTVGPVATNLTGSREPTAYTSITDLPSAPINSLASTNPIPYQDPALEKASLQMLNGLKQDMDAFASFEVPQLQDKSDPAVKLPLVRFQGDYQRVKDELLVVTQNPGLQPQLTVEDINTMGANLRSLQRTYRVYADNKMVPEPPKGKEEGFQAAIPTSDSQPISYDQLQLLSQKVSVEIVRLQASGTSDPVTQARVHVFTQIKQTVDSMIASIQNGTMDPVTIPIKTGDYNKFLPALGNNSAGIAGLLSSSGYPTLSSLFNGYDAGDISGSQIAAHMFETYADSLLKGMSYKVDVSYTSPNEVALRQAEASAANALAGMGNGSPSIQYSSYSPSFGDSTLLSTQHPLTMFGSRGTFDSKIRQMDMANYTDQQGVVGPNGPNGQGPNGQGPNGQGQQKAGRFDWKNLAQAIARNVRNMGLDPEDFGIMQDTASVGPMGPKDPEFSWRGYTKMVCTRLATHSDPGVPEQAGCPPVSWKGWSI